MTYTPPDNNDDKQPAEKVASEFEQFVRAEAERKMAEVHKRYEAAWQRVAGTIQEAGQAKSRFLYAREQGSDIMDAALTFRNSESAMLEAVNAMVELISKEHSL